MTIRRVIFLLFFCFLFFSVSVMGYDNIIIHPRLTSKAIETYNSLGKIKLSSQQENWIIQGSIAEDADPRYLNHFYDPTTGRGLNDGVFYGKSAKEWAKKQNSVSGDYSESAIFINYKKGDYLRAYQGVGHILHLVQDMSVPAHARNDAHPKGDPYEAWAKKRGNAVSNNKYVYVNNLDNVFDDLSNYTNSNFLSIDTISFSNYKDIKIKNFNGSEYVVNSIDNQEYKIVEIDRSGLIPVYDINKSIVHQDYWNMLHPKAIGYSAGVIDYFMREFQKIDNEREKGKLGLWNSFKKNFVLTLNNFKYVFGDSIIATHATIENIKKGHEEYVRIVNNEAMEFENTISSLSGKVLGVITAEDLFIPKEAGASDEAGYISTVSATEKNESIVQVEEALDKGDTKNTENTKIQKNENTENTETQKSFGSAPDEQDKSSEQEKTEEKIDDNFDGSDGEQADSPVSFPVHLFTSSDTIAPEISISEKPSLNATSTMASFRFFSKEDEVSYKYNLYSGAWTECSSFLVLTNISEGNHTLEVIGSDKYGNESEVVSHSWSIDSIGPVATLGSLNSSYTETGFDISWSATDSGSAIENYDLGYNINSNGWEDYISATTSTSTVFNINLAVDDIVEFKVRATDELDNVGDWSEIASTTIISSSMIADYVVISEIQIAGDSVTDEFIELYNPTDNEINLSSYRLSRKTASGNEYNLVTTFPDVTIESNAYYLITHPSGYTGDVTSDIIYSTSQSVASDNTIILYSDSGSTIVDKVGTGSATNFETSAYPDNPGANESLIRKASASSTKDVLISGSEEWEGNGYDSNDNSSDFILSDAPGPQNKESASEPRNNAPIIPGKVSDLSIISASTTKISIKLSFSTTNNNSEGSGAYYDLRYKEKSGDCDLNIDWNNASQVASSSLPTPSDNSGETHEVEITSLSINTEYCFALKIFNDENWSVLSNQISGSTNKDDVLVDSTASTYSGWANNLNWAHTVSGSDRLLVVPVSWRDKNYVINSIKYGSENLSLAVEEIGGNNHMRTSIYYLVNPPIGTNNINIDFSMSTYCGASSISLNNVDTSDPIMATTSRMFQNARIFSSIDLSSNGMIIDSFSAKKSEGEVVVDNLQTEVFNQKIGSITFPFWGGSSYRSVSSMGTYEMGWDIVTSLIWSQAIIAINPL